MHLCKKNQASLFFAFDFHYLWSLNKRIFMARRKAKKKDSKGLLYFILLVCAAFIGYGPLSNAWKSGLIHLDRLPQSIKSAVQTSEPETQTNLSTTQGLEIPAPLKGINETILKRKGYTVSYNRTLNLPNWVAWELNRDKLIERESRTDKFLPDPVTCVPLPTTAGTGAPCKKAST